LTETFWTGLADSKMETRHIKLEYNEGLDMKKQLLTLELNLLHILKKISNYRSLRKRETSIGSKMKSALTATRAKINSLYKSFPPELRPKEKPSRKKSNGELRKRGPKGPREPKFESKFQKELEEIRDKLKRLS